MTEQDEKAVKLIQAKLDESYGDGLAGARGLNKFKTNPSASDLWQQLKELMESEG